jgi:hypothetical protein
MKKYLRYAIYALVVVFAIIGLFFTAVFAGM